MPHVINLSRSEAEYFPILVEPEISIPFNIEDSIWIEIHEPSPPPGYKPGRIFKTDFISNPTFRNLPKLEIRFWDLVQSVPLVGTSEHLHPPDEYDAKKIVDFILAHPTKNVIVNCRAGKCRSGAVAQFCQDYLGYYWGPGKKRAVPNSLVLKLLAEYYGKPAKTIVTDKRRKWL